MMHAGPIRGGLVLAVSAVLLVTSARTAEAGFPGANGVIAFESRVDGDIWIIDPVTGDQSRLIADGMHPAWSASGQRLAFVRAGGIWVAAADGSDRVPLSSGGDDSAPAWSPDGTRIAFNRGGGIWVMRADGTGQAALTPDGSDPAWSPDGRRIAYARSSGVWTMDSDGDDRRLVASPIQADPSSDDIWIPEKPDWSPDGRQLVMQYSFSGPCDGCFLLYRMPAGGGTPAQIDTTSAGAPSWSPDGTQIVAHAVEGLPLLSLPTGARFLLEGEFFDFSFPSWQPLPAPSPDDTTPPFVAWRNPVTGQEVSGVLTEPDGSCLVEARDASGIAYTENYVDGVFHDKQVFAPWSCEIDTRTLADGPHTLTARAYDRAGNVAEASAHVTVRNQNTPAQLPQPQTPSGAAPSAPAGGVLSAPFVTNLVTSRQAKRQVRRKLARKSRSFRQARRHRIRCRPNATRTVQTCTVRWSVRGKVYTGRVRVRRGASGYVVKVVSLRVVAKRA